MSFGDHAVMKSVRKALGRDRTPESVPEPPKLDEPLIRLVHSDFGLPELFCARARENKMHVHLVSAEDVGARVAARAKELGLASVAYPVSPLLEKLGVPEALKAAGVRMERWDEPGNSLDKAYDVDAGLTDAWAAVAETGSIVIRPNAGHGRAISLVPAYHLVVLEPKVFVGDLVDLFEKLDKDGNAGGCVIITGPSKTADIEMNLVVGVHGPGQVEVFVLR